MTKKGLIEYWKRFRNKDMVKEFYFKSKVKQIKIQMERSFDIWVKKVITIFHKEEQPSLQEALFSNINTKYMNLNNSN